MDPFRLCLAFGPVAMYLLLLGAINVSRRPVLVSGVRDAATLALALSGLAIVGPIELFFPYAAAAHFGGYTWVLLLALYAMGVVLVLLLLRPRLILYNISADKLRPILADVVDRLDTEARWAGDSLVLPQLGVQLYVDSFAALRSVSLVSAGSKQDPAGWRRLETALGSALAREEVHRDPRGLILSGMSVAILTLLIMAVARNPQSAAQSLLDIARTLMTMLGL